MPFSVGRNIRIWVDSLLVLHSRGPLKYVFKCFVHIWNRKTTYVIKEKLINLRKIASYKRDASLLYIFKSVLYVELKFWILNTYQVASLIIIYFKRNHLITFFFLSLLPLEGGKWVDCSLLIQMNWFKFQLQSLLIVGPTSSPFLPPSIYHMKMKIILAWRGE